MGNPIKLMLLGITILLVTIFFQQVVSPVGGNPSPVLQLLLVLGIGTTLVGFFKNK
ncbi:hypothetical protein [Mangrovibacillus cuniculi]|uniref:PEP-CTERM protein-sorting domain-containing protein n=1 Tax=Mangrovibacillus cuniculi TaxID=2593652 RepID=A0A7S8C9J3_9BACI|nr:hypothetical protein [Mangrovibacillus cuniculi]QPC45916.1 hypothetical protein G8O30_02560 [Mangrovibacillus cuniculi]